MTDPKEHLHDVITHFDEAMLITRTREDGLHARPMVIAHAEGDGSLWFVTPVDSGKVDEMLEDPRTSVTMQGGGRYLAASGQAQIVRDPAQIARLWKPTWKPWFPEGKDDPSLVLIHLATERAEYWDRAGAKGIAYVFEAAKAMAQGRRAGQGDRDSQHGDVRLP